MNEVKGDKKRKDKKHFQQTIYSDWCKACGICIAFCPVKVLEADKQGKPKAVRPGDCIGCRFCELHCPDFAITIKEVHPGKKDTGE